MNSSNPERKSRITYKPGGFLSMNAAQPFIPGFFTPITIAHPLFISWWKEFHDHIFSEPVHSFCLELMPDFQPTSEVTHLSFFL
jgi:hypothetical protein